MSKPKGSISLTVVCVCGVYVCARLMEPVAACHNDDSAVHSERVQCAPSLLHREACRQRAHLRDPSVHGRTTVGMDRVSVLGGGPTPRGHRQPRFCRRAEEVAGYGANTTTRRLWHGPGLHQWTSPTCAEENVHLSFGQRVVGLCSVVIVQRGRACRASCHSPLAAATLQC